MEVFRHYSEIIAKVIEIVVCGPEAALAPPRVRFHEPQARDCSYGMHTDNVTVKSTERMIVLKKIIVRKCVFDVISIFILLSNTKCNFCSFYFLLKIFPFEIFHLLSCVISRFSRFPLNFILDSL